MVSVVFTVLYFVEGSVIFVKMKKAPALHGILKINFKLYGSELILQNKGFTTVNIVLSSQD